MISTQKVIDCEILIVGAGLAGGLIALALLQKRPDVRLLLVDGADHAGGNHVWSFFDSDISDESRALLAPLIAHRWPAGHEVRFPGYVRHIDTPYSSITSGRFDAHLREMLRQRLLLGNPIIAMDAFGAILANGISIRANAVIDARGSGSSAFFKGDGTSSDMDGLSTRDLSGQGSLKPLPGDGPASQDAGLFSGGALDCGWQKFVGQTFHLTAAHGLDRPIIMDATVEQIDGYRFIYALPVREREIFIEDTYYSDAPDIDVPLIRHRISDYATMQGWTCEAVVHEETGVLPVVKGGSFDRFWPSTEMVARAGTRSGLFHALTGYSLPMASALAIDLARGAAASDPDLASKLRKRAKKHWRMQAFYRMLSRLLFDAAPPPDRRRIFERFYRLPAPLIARFYEGRSTTMDKLRILCGRPPVPIRAAMRALWNHFRG